MVSLKEIHTIENQKKIWHWLRNGNLKWETENVLSAAEEQALNTNSVRKNADYEEHIGTCSAHSEWLHFVSTESVQEFKISISVSIILNLFIKFWNWVCSFQQTMLLHKKCAANCIKV